MRSDAANNQNPDEIEVFLIARALCKRVWLIIGIAAIVVGLGVMYAFFSERVYEARAYLVPPTQSDIADLNTGRTREFELTPYSIEDVYRLFVRNLRSESLRQEFFVDEYLPSLSDDQKTRSQDALYSEYSKKIQVNPVTADEEGRYSVVVQTMSSEKAVDWVKKYVKRAESRATKEIMKNVSYEAKIRAKNTSQEIDTKRETGETSRGDTITKLRAALSVAEAAGVQKPTVVFGGAPAGVAGNMEGEMSFLRGVEAIKAEIKNLESRSSNDAFIKELRGLQAKKSFYEKLAVAPREIDMYRYDGVVETPENAIKPKKTLVIALALVLGLMLGVLSAFTQYRWEETRKKAYT
ncbi:chain-length determining protein [Pseudomonas sp. ANT_J12]|uniref:Wzz/FepE/Etk N-terminal domain-containing protein n=1 Tax=Pseudomonas sp. ANT_J12 TaxID=2597351 RepID=UPI0011F1DAA6|nr:Wzz/FepE/Etk N-terminal domain-containing protein [Pseudomonas sp. ANT_J12]KAA0987717.1 chain-length determining protein [Pseudomonas sp. ANT_J12]